MFQEVMVCLDGSLFAEKILPYAQAIVGTVGGKLTLLRVVANEGESAAAESYLQVCARRWGAGIKVQIARLDAESSILEELSKNPGAIAAITTHGRSGLLEALMGSVALSVIRGARRPVLLYRPWAAAKAAEKDQEIKISSVVAALDGSEFSESILSFAAETARSLKAKLELVQVLPSQGSEEISAKLKRDIVEYSYVRRQAEATRRGYGLEVGWDVLHGDPGEGICNHVQGRDDVILAMTTRARAGLEQAVFGSVTSECVRRAGVLLLVYWPRL